MVQTGDLVGISPESLAPGHSPLLTFSSKNEIRVAKLSGNVAEPISVLRAIAADNDYFVNFQPCNSPEEELERRIASALQGRNRPEAWMQLHIHGGRVRVNIEGQLRFVPSHFGPREAAWDLYGPRLDPYRRKLEINSWVQLHHLALMKSHGRSVARSIARSKAAGTSREAGAAIQAPEEEA